MAKIELKKMTDFIPKRAVGILLMFLLVSISLGYGDTIKLSNGNHNYPIYQLMTLTLNNKTQDNIQAQIMLYNQSTDSWQVNQVLLDLINQDLDSLTQYISGLKQITLYDYNDSFLPGEVFFLLSPKVLKDAADVANETIDYILSHNSIWWYVTNITIDYLNLGLFEYFYPLSEDLDEDYISIIDIVSTINYTIVNNTFIPSYPQRNNITASILIYNGTDWVYNEPFLKYFNETLEFLNSQEIFQSTGVRLNPCSSELLESSKSLLNHFNLTPTLPENFTQVELNHLFYAPSSFYIEIDYTSLNNNEHYASFNTNKKNLMYLTIFGLIQHLWFATNVHPLEGYNIGGTPISYIPILLIVSFLTVVTLVVILRVQKRKKV